MFDKLIDGQVTSTLKNRINAMNREGTYAPLEPQNETINDTFLTDMMTKSVWARATSSTLSNDGGEVQLKRISTAWKNLQSRDPVNRPLSSQVSLFTSSPTATFRPHNGITSINTQYKNSYMQYVTINFTLWDKNQFSIYENAFLKHGRIVCVEWGWSTSAQGGIDPSTGSSLNSLMKSQQRQILSKGGDYCAATGKIKSFSWNIGPNGEYKCTTELISMANDVLGGQIDSSKKSKIVPLYKNTNVTEAMKNANLRFGEWMDKLDEWIEQDTDGGGYFSTDLRKGWCTWGWFEDRLNAFFGMSNNGQLISRIDSTKSPCLKNGKLYAISWHCMTGKVDKIDDIDAFLGKDRDGEKDEKYKGFDEETKAKYKIVKKVLTDLSGLVEPGKVRGFVFSAKFLQQNFGSGVSDIENALQTFWSTVSGVYGGYYNFRVYNDIESEAVPRIGIRDENTTEVSVKSSNFTFSVYGKNSIMKDFNLNVKMDSKMVTQAMYHSGKGPSSTGDQSINAPEDLAIKALGTLQSQRVSGKTEGEEQVLRDLTFPFMDGKMVGKGGAIKNVTPDQWKVLTADGKGGEKEVVETWKELDRRNTNEKQIAEMEEKGIAYPEGKEGGPFLIWDTEGEVITGFRKAMLALLTEKNDSAAGIAPIVPISISFTIPGIGGIRPFNIFNIDYLPPAYDQYCDFRVKSVNHDVSPQGWNTKIEAMMRVDWNKVKGAATSDGGGDDSTFSASDYTKLWVELQNSKLEK